MTVAELLSRISSRELSEWRAFEQAFGPLGTVYADRTLAELHEMTQTLIALWASKEVQVRPYPRRDQFYIPTAEPDDEVDWAEFARRQLDK